MYSVELNYLHVYFIYTFNKYLWSVDHVADNILGSRHTIMNRAFRVNYLEVTAVVSRLCCTLDSPKGY